LPVDLFGKVDECFEENKDQLTVLARILKQKMNSYHKCMRKIKEV